MNIKPIRDLIVVTKEGGEKVSSGGIHLVESVEKTVSGTVLAVGSGYVTESGTIVPLEVKVGDRVSFNKNMASEMTTNGESVLLLREENVLCVTNA